MISQSQSSIINSSVSSHSVSIIGGVERLLSEPNESLKMMAPML